MAAEAVEVVYQVHLQFNVKDVEEKLGINWEDVVSWHVKWAKLFVRMADGSLLEMEGPDMDSYYSWKHPDCAWEIHENGDVVPMED